MPINNIPGVGPTNADIATAVAAPSASTIAAAVAAPSAATIAAAVAAPSAATIASAVAAPSSATIASAVAAAVPTLSQINTSVANNAPSPNAWTLIGSVAWTGGAVTFTGLSGYKSYRMVITRANVASAQAGSQMAIRVNGDTTAVYNAQSSLSNSSSVSTSTQAYIAQSSAMFVGDVISNGTSGYTSGIIEFHNANIAAPKNVTWDLALRTDSQVSGQISRGTGIYFTTTNNISSVSYFIFNGATMNQSIGNTYLYGAN